MIAKPKKFSVYEFEKKGVVSIWLAIVPLSRIPKDYFEEHYGRDDDQPFNQFSDDFGFDYYDHDYVDTNISERHAKSVEDLVSECSFSSSYVKEVAAVAKKQGIQETQFVFLLYNIQ